MAKWGERAVPGTEYFDQSDAVTVDKDELKKLREDSSMLAALRAAGVDNWEGYSIAYREAMGDSEGDDE